jgi:chaperone BCS1
MEDIDAAFHQGLNRENDPSPLEPDENGSRPLNQGRSPTSRSSCRISLSGLLNALDGIGAQEGRILYATTNKFSALDPALCRPGRMDLHIEFKLASKFQARKLFRAFYLPSEVLSEKEVTDSEYASPTVPDRDLIDLGSLDDKYDPSDLGPGLEAMTPPNATTGKSHKSRLLQLSHGQLQNLARRFAETLPEREFSMASLQGYLMTFKTRPFEAVRDFGAWIEKERAERAEKERSSSPTKSAPASPISMCSSAASDTEIG